MRRINSGLDYLFYQDFLAPADSGRISLFSAAVISTGRIAICLHYCLVVFHFQALAGLNPICSRITGAFLPIFQIMLKLKGMPLSETSAIRQLTDKEYRRNRCLLLGKII